jgi:hypothetical protein
MSDDSEEARAFLQARVTLFWKVMFFITLFGNGLGAPQTLRIDGSRAT